MFDEIINILCENSKHLNDRIDGEFFKNLQNENVIYSHVSHINTIDKNKINTNNVLIVRDGDTPFSNEMFESLKGFKHYYVQNKTSTKENVSCIPIGMEAKSWCYFDKFEVIKKCRVKNTIPSKLLYGNFSLATNLHKRTECLKSFKDKPYFTNNVEIMLKHPTKLTENEYEKFCDEILNHVFVLCPEGNGLDTHRMWETLYLGRIPVVLKNSVTENFEELPILILNKWDEFVDKYPKMISEIENGKIFNYEKMTKEYWIKDIKRGNLI